MPTRAIVLVALWASATLPVWAAPKTLSVDEVTAQVARAHNAQNFADEMTVSSRAVAQGRMVVFRNVVRARKGLSAQERMAFLVDVSGELVPRVCAAHRDVFARKQGIAYTFLYENTFGERIAEVEIDEKDCAVR